MCVRDCQRLHTHFTHTHSHTHTHTHTHSLFPPPRRSRLVDAVTGRVLHAQSQPGLRGPAAALLSENLAVVQLWDEKAAR